MPSQISYSPISKNPNASYTLIYFITGNPGLIGYYTTFLSTLNTLLSSSSTPTSTIHINGQSLFGFEDEDISANTDSPYTLEQEIQLSLQSIKTQRIPSGPRENQPYDNIILIGHSVGAYILLEAISRLRNTNTPMKINGGILLFPTVTHLAQSPSGVKFTSLCRIPNFPQTANLVAKVLLWSLPWAATRWFVGLVTGMPPDMAQVTAKFLRSRMGVWQALRMAKDEMEVVTEDRWDDEIWGIEHDSGEKQKNIPKLVFYFGQDDHWVANHTRDELIAARGGSETSKSKPVMLIDENNVPHSFCLMSLLQRGLRNATALIFHAFSSRAYRPVRVRNAMVLRRRFFKTIDDL
ncbi:hypothetical protein B7494_g4733 [Chlorociboria aeruginascens]|nr:hypothetical protein B7494_g4733 [Chlorociboria aeruginascens]